MSFANEFSCDGVMPSGPVSAWPKERHEQMMERFKQTPSPFASKQEKPGIKAMAKTLAQTTRQAIRHGKVSSKVREERYKTCKSCPFFDAASKRCNDCGCFMEAKTWVGGDPDMLCPQKKWSR
jgi:hypothetical protein